MQALSLDSVDKSLSYSKQKVPLALDNNCLSCTGVPSHMMQLFKTACISYQPGEVQYRRQLHTRTKLLNMRKALIDKCEDVINNMQWPLSEQGINTSKIFKDLV